MAEDVLRPLPRSPGAPPWPAPLRPVRAPLSWASPTGAAASTSSTMKRASWRAPPTTTATSSTTARVATSPGLQPAAPAPGLRRLPPPPPRRSLAAVFLAAELAGPLVRHRCVGQLVEVARQHLVELVEGQVDPVVGDPVLLEVVVRILLVRFPAPTWPRRWADMAAAWRSCSALNSLARNTTMALARFCIWLFSSCMATTVPVGGG